MPSCYICNAALRQRDGIRREVRTGSASGQSSRGSSWERTHHGVRTICKPCSTQLDEEIRRRRKIAIFVLLPLATLIAVVSMYAIWANLMNVLHNGVKI